MDENCIKYIAILESENEILRNKLLVPSVWEPYWKSFDKFPDRFDLMVNNIRLATATRYASIGTWEVSCLGNVMLTVNVVKSLDEVKWIIIDRMEIKPT